MNDRLVWAAFGMLALLVSLSGLMVFGSIFFAPVSNDIAREMIEGRIIARAIVLYLIIPIIYVMAAQDKITGEAALAALSAIAGYILGGTSTK